MRQHAVCDEQSVFTQIDKNKLDNGQHTGFGDGSLRDKWMVNVVWKKKTRV
jgi:hypothetical protein